MVVAIKQRYVKMLSARDQQIIALSVFLIFGLLAKRVSVPWWHMASVTATAIAAQYLGTRYAKLPRFDPKSATITLLSLILLLRTTHPAVSVTAAACAILSKFFLRAHNQHIFNPANFGIAAAILGAQSYRVITGRAAGAWISPGQWGSGLLIALLITCLGLIVLRRAKRINTGIAFMLVYGVLTLSRSFWLGDPLTIPVHGLTSGSLLIFSFFMISDPKTTPASSHGRWLFAAAVATVAFILRQRFQIDQAPIWALALCAPLNLLRRTPGRQFDQKG